MVILEIDVKADFFSDKKVLKLSEYRGTRHRSAIRWCAAQQDAGVAIVASQDGGATMFCKVPGQGTVLAYRPYTVDF